MVFLSAGSIHIKNPFTYYGTKHKRWIFQYDDKAIAEGIDVKVHITDKTFPSGQRSNRDNPLIESESPTAKPSNAKVEPEGGYSPALEAQANATLELKANLTRVLTFLKNHENGKAKEGELAVAFVTLLNTHVPEIDPKQMGPIHANEFPIGKDGVSLERFEKGFQKHGLPFLILTHKQFTTRLTEIRNQEGKENPNEDAAKKHKAKISRFVSLQNKIFNALARYEETKDRKFAIEAAALNMELTKINLDIEIFRIFPGNKIDPKDRIQKTDNSATARKKALRGLNTHGKDYLYESFKAIQLMMDELTQKIKEKDQQPRQKKIPRKKPTISQKWQSPKPEARIRSFRSRRLASPCPSAFCFGGNRKAV